jgi:hypothetical protein
MRQRWPATIDSRSQRRDDGPIQEIREIMEITEIIHREIRRSKKTLYGSLGATPPATIDSR